jgi:hypothetical protein
MLIIFVDKKTRRQEYVFSHIFDFFGIDFMLTEDPRFFTSTDQPKFSYSKIIFENTLYVIPAGLLAEEEIRNFCPQTGSFEGVKTLFPVGDRNAALPYDVFSAVFYMISRYEEYLPFSADKYGRFEASNSIAYKNGFLYVPVVDYWMLQLLSVLTQKYSSLKAVSKNFSFIPTYDIDIAYAYKAKGIKRQLGGLFRDIIKFNFHLVFLRFFVFIGISKDPYDSYDFQFEMQEKYNLTPWYFFHAGTNGKLDKNSLPEKKRIKKLLFSIQKKSNLGLHPSFRSKAEHELLSLELNRLEKASQSTITSVRQHFLALQLPETYRNYILCGIKDDYSMGFATDFGFRAGTSQPFRFFDLKENVATHLNIHPFVFMDSTLCNYKKISNENAMELIRPVIEKIHETQGTFIGIWHNFYLGPEKKWDAKRELFEDIASYIKGILNK